MMVNLLLNREQYTSNLLKFVVVEVLEIFSWMLWYLNNQVVEPPFFKELLQVPGLYVEEDAACGRRDIGRNRIEA